jgi:GAF domain-containing protein
MISEGHALGAMTIQSTQPEAFDQDDIAVLQGIADSLASAINNARLFNQVQENLEEIQSLHRQYLSRSWEMIAAREGLTSYTDEAQLNNNEIQSEEEPAIIEVPIVLRNQIIGAISVERDQKPWTTEDQSLIESIASQAALALENSRLIEQTQRDALYERAMTEVTSKIWASTDVDTILRTTLEELGHILQASDGLIQLKISEDQEELQS